MLNLKCGGRERLILLVALWSTKRGRLIPSTDQDQDPRDPRARARERLILLVTRTRKERLNPRESPDQTVQDQDQDQDPLVRRELPAAETDMELWCISLEIISMYFCNKTVIYQFGWRIAVSASEGLSRDQWLQLSHCAHLEVHWPALHSPSPSSPQRQEEEHWTRQKIENICTRL